jgi:glycosyltransferase involved in cell wall biosynthesis
MPLVSVIMPVYNAEKFIKETIDSILIQSLEDFEFIIVDDASTDTSVDIIKSYKDTRIRFFQNEKNIGYVATLNKMINLATGEFIARQDNDDISHPDRLKTQVFFLMKNKNIGVCGSYVRYIGKKRGLLKRPARDKDIRGYLLFFCPMVHPSVMIRKSLFDQGIRYDEALIPAEDYNLWFDVSQKMELSNIPKVLLYYRIHENNVSKLKHDIQVENSNIIRCKIIEYSLNIQLTDEEKYIHKMVVYPYLNNCNDLFLIQNWLMKIKTLNEKNRYYDSKSLDYILFEMWSVVCRNNNVISPFKILCLYYKSDFLNFFQGFTVEALKTLLKNILRVIK